MSQTDYLLLRGRTWYVRVSVPRHLWKAVGKREFVRSLKTRNRDEADRLKHPWIAEFKRLIREAERNPLNPEAAEMLETVAALKTTLARYRDRWQHSRDEDDQAEAQAAIEAAIEDAEDALGSGERAEQAMDAALGEATLLADLYPRWLAATEFEQKQRDSYESKVQAFIEWAGAGVAVEHVDRAKAGAFLEHLRGQGKARATSANYCSALSSLWSWLGENGTVAEGVNPWSGRRSLRARAADRQGPKRKGLPDDKLVKLLSAVYTDERTGEPSPYAQAIADLLRLALVTGARLEELGALKRADVTERDDGYWFIVAKAKTAAGTGRLVPIHYMTAHIIKRRMIGARDGFLFNDITPGAYGRRTHHVSKAYRRFREQAGVGDRWEDKASLAKALLEDHYEHHVGVIPATTVRTPLAVNDSH